MIGQSNKEANNSTNKLTIVLFALYLIALSWILLFKMGVRFTYMENRKVNLMPFSEFLISNGKIDFGGLIMNVLIFVPLGVYAGVLFKRWNFGKNLLFFFSIGLIVEGLQFIFRLGAFDITDTMTNTLGGFIGLMLFKGIEKGFKNSVKAQKFVNIIATIGTVVMILLLVLLKTNSLGIRYQ